MKIYKMTDKQLEKRIQVLKDRLEAIEWLLESLEADSDYKANYKDTLGLKGDVENEIQMIEEEQADRKQDYSYEEEQDIRYQDEVDRRLMA